MKVLSRWASAFGAVAILAGAGAFGVLALNQQTVQTHVTPDSNFSIASTQTVNPVKAVDTSAVIRDSNWFTLAYAQGVRLYILPTSVTANCAPWSRAQEQIKLALQAGINYAAYTTAPGCWKQGIESVGAYRNQMQFFAVDAETPVTRSTIDGIKATGVRPVLRTGAATWSKSMGASVAFSDVLLWESGTTAPVPLANWTANLDRPAPTEFGGWNSSENPRVAVQQATNVMLNDVVVNLDVVDSSYLR